MTPNSRPNLGGLFTGNTPPERSSAVAAQLGPRLVTAPPAADSKDVTAARDITEPSPEPEPAPTGDTPAPDVASGPVRELGADVPPLGAPVGQSTVAVALEFIDPLRVVERYFAFLQVVLDVNRRAAIALTTTAISLPRRAGIWR
jgi:hypothetical protein